MELSILETSAREIVRGCEEHGIAIRLSGSLGYRLRCQEFGPFQLREGRQINDIDLVAYVKDKQRLERLMDQMGYEINKEIASIPGLPRSVFYSRQHGFHCDVFYNALVFCHTIDLRARLEVDRWTIPLMELLLQKLQIVRINRKDIYDLQMLLRSHSLGNKDGELINLQLLADLCRYDWGLWQTVTTNLTLLNELTQADKELLLEDKDFIKGQIAEILEKLERTTKTVRWKLRSAVGKKMAWYNEVEEIDHYAEVKGGSDERWSK